MGFIRCLDEKQINAMFGDKNIELFDELKRDVLAGVVFPAIRKNQIYFYYEGGCLYKFSNGSFKRDKAFEKYAIKAENISTYEIAKMQVGNKFINTNGSYKERRLLNSLYSHTFGSECKYNTVVLDIEVNLNGNFACGKKCDLVLYNVPLGELMFVEGKVFSDSRVNVKCGSIPKVIEQVKMYSAAIGEQSQTIIEQYVNHIDIINRIFGTKYPIPTKLIGTVKLLVYDTPQNLTENNIYSIDTITASLGKNNVIWFEKERPSTDEIWNNLCK